MAYPHYLNMVFGIPFSGRSLPPEIMLAFHGISMPMNTNMINMTTKGIAIDLARNQFAEAAVKENAKYLLFWDEDVIVPPQSYRELIYKMNHYPDAAVISGVYCLKAEPAEPLVFVGGNGRGAYWDWKIGEFFECSGVGMGCAVIRVEALKDIPKPWFKTVNDYSKTLDGIPNFESFTEDLWFCDQIAKTKKWKVYCDSSILCAHVDLATGKQYGLPLDSKPRRHLMVPKGKKRILDIGAGKNKYQTNEGTVVTVDCDESVNPDYRCDCRKLPFDKETFDVVHSGHLLEYIEPDELEETLTEWTRVLKRKGELRLTVPNLEYIADQIKSGKQVQFFNGAKAGFTPKSLEAQLKPFYKTCKFSVGNDISVVATKT